MSNVTALKVSLGFCVSIFVFLIVSFSMYSVMKRRKFERIKEKYFKENGGLLLRQELARGDRGGRFTADELMKATNNYNESGKLGEGPCGEVYKGILEKDQAVAIKMFSMTSITQSEKFRYEMATVSQINHKNVIRYIGCCMNVALVYEFMSNGTLYDNLHPKNAKGSSLSLATRLKIAAEVAATLDYLYHCTSEFVHRNVKSTNILLDADYTAKLSGFGVSSPIPLSTLVQGTLVYLDPEYIHSNVLTQKSDVYSFGVVIVELLTGKEVLSLDRPDAERNIASFFVSSMQDGSLDQILDDEMLKEGTIEIVKKVADLAERCLRLRGEERPNIHDVAMELEGLHIRADNSDGGKAEFIQSPLETDRLLRSRSNAYIVDVRCDGSTSNNTE